MLKTELASYDNSWYKPGKPPKIFFWYIFNNFFINTCVPYPLKFKLMVLKVFGCQIGKGVFIKPKVSIKYPWLLTIGNNVWIGENVWMDNLAKVTIGDNVCISQGAMLLCGNHNYKKSTFDLILGEIHLKEGSWIGAQSVVCPGVIVNSHAILSAGSIATKDLDGYGIYQGNPANKIRTRIIESK
jgi:putative colanic acid biosynthesis acetyltransferase WcaF